MIFCGFGKTSLIGSSVRLTENFVNILGCFRRCIARRYGKQVADELLVAGVKLIVCDGTERQKEIEDDFVKILTELNPEAEVILKNNGEGGA